MFSDLASKIAKLLGSDRFWLITATAVVSYFNGIDPLTVMQVWAAAVVGIGTVEKVATKIGGN